MRAALLPALLFLLGVSPALAVPCPQHFLNSQPPILRNAKLAERTHLLCNDAFAALASGVTRGALWSAQRLTAESVTAAKTVERVNRFHADPRLPRADRAELEDYARSRFDRGHLAPSGDMPTPHAQRQSFSLGNIVPQTPALNRGEWSELEDDVRQMALRRGDLYVVTGAVYEGAQTPFIGRGVLVPSGTWKAVHDVRTGGTVAWLCTNVADPACETLSVEALAARTDIYPFPGAGPNSPFSILPE